MKPRGPLKAPAHRRQVEYRLQIPHSFSSPRPRIGSRCFIGTRPGRPAASLRDPAEMLAEGFRLTARLFPREAALMQVAPSASRGMKEVQRGLVPYTRRDLEAGIRAGRFSLRIASAPLLR